MTAPAEGQPKSNGESLEEIREITSIVDGLISMMSAGNIGSLKLEYGSLRLSLRSKDEASVPAAPIAHNSHPPTTVAESVPDLQPSLDGFVITAPMIGTFYIAPAPNEPPFVLPGDEVTEGQTIGIIEAMKIMNEIAADRAGTVVEVIASDGQTVEYGSPLLRIDPRVE